MIKLFRNLFESNHSLRVPQSNSTAIIDFYHTNQNAISLIESENPDPLQKSNTGNFFKELKIMKKTPINIAESTNFITDSLKNIPISRDLPEQKPEELNIDEKFKREIYITNWLDYSAKYGIGYILSDGSIGVFFNDSSKMLIKGDNFFYYIERSKGSLSDNFNEYHINGFPAELQKKVMLLKHFKSYLGENMEEEKKNTREIGFLLSFLCVLLRIN